MAEKIVPNQAQLDWVRDAVNRQYESMFDAETREKLTELGIQKLLDHHVTRIATQEAIITFYSNCLHPK